MKNQRKNKRYERRRISRTVRSFSELSRDEFFIFKGDRLGYIYKKISSRKYVMSALPELSYTASGNEAIGMNWKVKIF